jgi:hypothetical protein
MTIAHNYIENLAKVQYQETLGTKGDNMPFELRT